MTEYNIFEIIRKEKKSIALIAPYNINKIYSKYFFKYILEIKNKLFEIEKESFINDKEEQISFNYEKDIEIVSNMVYHIFWILFLTSFNIHITIFFIERAMLLFSEFINLSLKEKDYIIESNSHINDAIIFTYKKTIGNITLQEIIDENESKKYTFDYDKYKKILKVRDNTYLVTKIINKIVLSDNLEIAKHQKNNKYLIQPLYNIYQNINIDQYLFFNFNKILNENTLDKALFLIRIIVEVINEFINMNFFEFNSEDKDINFFLEFLDNTLNNFINNEQFNNISYCTNDIHKKKIFIDFKESVLRYINI